MINDIDLKLAEDEPLQLINDMGSVSDVRLDKTNEE